MHQRLLKVNFDLIRARKLLFGKPAGACVAQRVARSGSDHLISRELKPEITWLGLHPGP